MDPAKQDGITTITLMTAALSTTTYYIVTSNFFNSLLCIQLVQSRSEPFILVIRGLVKLIKVSDTVIPPTY